MKLISGDFMPDTLKGSNLKNLEETVKKLKAELALHKKLSKVQISLTKQWQLIFDSINDALLLVDKDGYIVQCNKSMVKLIGKPSLEIIGSICWEIFHKKEERFEHCPFDQMAKSKTRVECIYKINGKNYKVILDPFLDENGKIFGAIHIFSEIKRKKKALN